MPCNRAAYVAVVSSVVGLCLTGCPQQVTPESLEGKVAKPDLVAADDPRVVADTDDLYAIESAPDRTKPKKAKGSGSTDETNGVCRLFAPKLPEPTCCPLDLGFDVPTVQEACGKLVYLGESMHSTCGYHFLDSESHEQRWFRLSQDFGSSVAEAAAAHDRLVATRLAKDPNFKSQPVPGVPGALWASHGGIHWAFVPGWPVVRKFTWRDESCSQEGVAKIIKALVKTPPVPKKQKRSS
ncbi:MAG: hypothetical protein ACPG4T_09145, partial [Nannocystaceae bacterium]